MISGIVDRVAHLLSDEVASHFQRFTDVVDSATYCSDLDSWSTVKVVNESKRGD